MQTERSFTDEIRYQYTHGGTHIRLIFINLAIFLFAGLLHVIERLSGGVGIPISPILDGIFLMQVEPTEFLHHPWGLITSIFAHYDILHFAMNMLFLYASGRMFLQFFSAKRLVHVYVLGGIAGNLFELLAHMIFPAISPAPVLGASAAVMAIFIAIAFYKPSLQISLFGVLNMPIILLAGIFLVLNLISLGADDHVAHFAHIGGALIGILSVQNLHARGNIVNSTERVEQSFRSFMNRLFKPKSRLRAEKGGRTVKTDEQYNMDARARQKRIDAILDKISKSGYESLTKAEKEFLFSQSKK